MDKQTILKAAEHCNSDGKCACCPCFDEPLEDCTKMFARFIAEKGKEPAAAGTVTSSKENILHRYNTTKPKLCQPLKLKRMPKYQVVCKKTVFYPITLSERAHMQEIANGITKLARACGYTDITDIQFVGKTKYRFAVNCTDGIRYVVPVTHLDRMTAVVNTLKTIQENERRLWNEH